MVAARPVRKALLRPTPLLVSRLQRRYASSSDVDDPDMNGGYINPPPQKRQFRDPYADWWDKQERRNYGEPVHEDNDILGMFSLEEYTHFKPGKAIFLVSCFVATVFGLCGVVSLYYPDKPSAPRAFPGGLDVELGGPGAILARSTEDES
ncbi:MAG: hypothetical protein MMC33_003008 [Icmadophila ericetorum]|nr:hypothetical protein [Icmadophila ericetorum]